MTLSDFSIQDEATTVSRTAKATTATTNHAGTTTTTIHPATDGKTNHAATDHQSAERSVAIMFDDHTLEQHDLSKESSRKKHVIKYKIFYNRVNLRNYILYIAIFRLTEILIHRLAAYIFTITFFKIFYWETSDEIFIYFWRASHQRMRILFPSKEHRPCESSKDSSPRTST